MIMKTHFSSSCCVSFRNHVRIDSALAHDFTESQALPFAFWACRFSLSTVLICCVCFICIGLRAERPAVWELSPWTAGSVRALTLNARKCGARALNNHKCGSYGFKCSKLWELSLQTTRSVGAVVLNAQKYGSSPFRRPKIWELSPQTVKVREFSLSMTKSVGALTLRV